MKKCRACAVEKPHTEFHRKSVLKDGLATYCKTCCSEKQKAMRAAFGERWRARDNARYTDKRAKQMREYGAQYYKANKSLISERLSKYQKHNLHKYAAWNAARYAAKTLATPKWVDLEKIKFVYEKAAQLGFEVDHVVPLQSPIVCGLHCESNLQLLSRTENVTKGNRHWPDMP